MSSTSSPQSSIASTAPSAAPIPAPHASASRGARERRKKLARNVRQGLLGAALLAGSVAAVLALRPQPVGADTARATLGPLSVVIDEDGMTRVKDRFTVSAPVTGSLSRLALEPGDAVK